MVINRFQKCFSFYRKPSNKWYDPKKVKQKTKTELFFNFGILSFVFAACYATIPLYKLFCQKVGLQGDMNQKKYTGKGTPESKFRKIKIIFRSEVDGNLDWEFEPVQKEIIVEPGQTTLSFYRAYNKTDEPIIGFATYQVFPGEASLYFSKIQCFCFHQQLLNSREEVMLPLYFYLEPEIAEDSILSHYNDIEIIYRFIKVKHQDLTRLVVEQEQREKEQKQALAKLRKSKFKDLN